MAAFEKTGIPFGRYRISVKAQKAAALDHKTIATNMGVGEVGKSTEVCYISLFFYLAPPLDVLIS